MSNVVDLRPDLVLRELREHGSLPRACLLARVTAQVLKELLTDYPKFATSMVECMREFAEEKVLKTQAEKYKTLTSNYNSTKRALDAETDRLVKEARDAATR